MIAMYDLMIIAPIFLVALACARIYFRSKKAWAEVVMWTGLIACMVILHVSEAGWTLSPSFALMAFVVCGWWSLAIALLKAWKASPMKK